jgi:uncharacterized protein (DUF1499 family)
MTAGLIIVLSMNSRVTAEPKILAPCPESPNCVSSLAGDRTHYIEPLVLQGDPQADWERLRVVIAAQPRTTITEESANYLHVEVRSLVFRFVDDLELLRIPDEQLVHVRSASRTGYSDLGVNRRRVERIRRLLSERRRD